MALATIFSAQTWRLDKTIWTLIVSVCTAIMVFETTSWLALACVVLLAGAAIHAARTHGYSISWKPPAEIFGVTLAAVLYLVISLLWSADPPQTVISALVLALLVVAVSCFSGVLRDGPDAWTEHLARAMLVAWLAALAFLLSELLTGDVVKKALYTPFRQYDWHGFWPTLSPNPRPVTIPPQAIKWNMAPLNYLLWPCLLIWSVQPVAARWWRWLAIPIAIAVLYTIHLSDHKTSLAALGCAAAAFAVAHRYPKAVFRVLQVYWIAGFVVIIPLALWAYNSELHLHNRTSRTMAARLILWNYTAERVLEHPYVGHGAAATSRIDNEREAKQKSDQPQGFNYPIRSGPHAHNVFLQSWYELGLFGTVIFLAGGLALINRLRAFPLSAQPYALATATTILITDAASFGLFEPWFMATTALCCMALVLAVREYQRAGG